MNKDQILKKVMTNRVWKTNRYLLPLSLSVSLFSEVVGDTSMLSVTSPNTFNAGTPDGGTPLNINGITLTFNQWNPSSFPGMTLTGVEYRLTSYAYGTYAIANGNQSARFEVELSRLSTSLTGPFSGSPNLIRTNTTFPDISQLFPNVLPNASLTGTTALSTSTPTDFTADSNFLSYVGAGT